MKENESKNWNIISRRYAMQKIEAKVGKELAEDYFISTAVIEQLGPESAIYPYHVARIATINKLLDATIDLDRDSA